MTSRELISEYSDIFALDPMDLGCTDLITHSIDTEDSPPIRQPVRRVPFALHSKMEELVQQMMKQSVFCGHMICHPCVLFLDWLLIIADLHLGLQTLFMHLRTRKNIGVRPRRRPFKD